MTTNNELIGRDEINDLEAILSVSNTDVDAVDHTVSAGFDAVFTWDYERTRPALGQALREGEDVAVERHHRPRLDDSGRPGGVGAQRDEP